jgi:hypothetical protein
VRGGSRIPVGLSASYVAGAAGTGTPAAGGLEESYDDGTTWHTVSPTGRDAAWRGTLTVPRTATSVSLRTSAKDDRGGSVTQEIVRAVGVK